MFVDFHTHLDFFKGNLEKALKDAKDNKIILVSNSMDISNYNEIKKLALEYDNIIASFGIHPWNADKVNSDLKELIPYIEESKLIGEIGLDYLWADKNTFDRQREIYYFILDEAIKRNKYITIHTKDAEKEIYNSILKYNYNRAIIHWYSGDRETLELLINLGVYFTISVDVYESDLTDYIIKKVPIDRLLSETDGPTALEWVNGEYAYPSYIRRVVKRISEVKNLSFEETKSQIYNNYLKIMND